MWSVTACGSGTFMLLEGLHDSPLDLLPGREDLHSKKNKINKDHAEVRAAILPKYMGLFVMPMSFCILFHNLKRCFSSIEQHEMRRSKVESWNTCYCGRRCLSFWYDFRN